MQTYFTILRKRRSIGTQRVKTVQLMYPGTISYVRVNYHLVSYSPCITIQRKRYNNLIIPYRHTDYYFLVINLQNKVSSCQKGQKLLQYQKGQMLLLYRHNFQLCICQGRHQWVHWSGSEYSNTLFPCVLFYHCSLITPGLIETGSDLVFLTVWLFLANPL